VNPSCKRYRSLSDPRPSLHLVYEIPRKPCVLRFGVRSSLRTRDSRKEAVIGS
jgi:hypothetical protein